MAGLGWSTIALLRGHGRTAVINTGNFGMRKLLIEGLRERGVRPADVTDVLLTHSHYDHAVNWTLFRHARIVIGETEPHLGGGRASGRDAGRGGFMPMRS